MRPYLAAGILVLSMLIAPRTQAQTAHLSYKDSMAIVNFVYEQEKVEKEFINLLRAGKPDSCLRYFDSGVIDLYGADSLRKEMKKLAGLFARYPFPETSSQLTMSANDVGGFGHDANASYEASVRYSFTDNKKEEVYYFTLYFTSRPPVKFITYYTSRSMKDW